MYHFSVFLLLDIDERKFQYKESARDRLCAWTSAISTRYHTGFLQGFQTEAKFTGHYVSVLK